MLLFGCSGRNVVNQCCDGLEAMLVLKAVKMFVKHLKMIALLL